MVTWLVLSVLIAVAAVGLHWHNSPLNLYTYLATSVGDIFIPGVYPLNNTADIQR
jgi:hypothetical protein